MFWFVGLVHVSSELQKRTSCLLPHRGFGTWQTPVLASMIGGRVSERTCCPLSRGRMAASDTPRSPDGKRLARLGGNGSCEDLWDFLKRRTREEGMRIQRHMHHVSWLLLGSMLHFRLLWFSGKSPLNC